MAKSYYEGSAPCHGCGRPGTIISRLSKDSLCEDCKKALQIGKASEKYRDTIKLTRLIVTWYSFGRREFDDLVSEFLKAISNEDGANVPTGMLRVHGDAVTSSNVYFVPRIFAEPLKRFLDGFSDFGRKMCRIEEQLEKKKQEELNDERNKIFNDGVAYGRKLLFQLNNNEISLKDFEAEVKKY